MKKFKLIIISTLMIVISFMLSSCRYRTYSHYGFQKVLAGRKDLDVSEVYVVNSYSNSKLDNDIKETCHKLILKDNSIEFVDDYDLDSINDLPQENQNMINEFIDYYNTVSIQTMYLKRYKDLKNNSNVDYEIKRECFSDGHPCYTINANYYDENNSLSMVTEEHGTLAGTYDYIMFYSYTKTYYNDNGFDYKEKIHFKIYLDKDHALLNSSHNPNRNY